MRNIRKRLTILFISVSFLFASGDNPAVARIICGSSARYTYDC